MEAIPDAKNPLKREKEGFENAPGLYLKKHCLERLNTCLCPRNRNAKVRDTPYLDT